MAIALWIVGVLVSLALVVLAVGRFWGHAGEPDPARARRTYDQQQAALQQELFRRAAATGRPRGLRWTRCDCDPRATFARDRANGQLLAFAGVTVSFEAIAGGPMEDVEAVGNLRAGTAIFTYQRGRWNTDGRVLFNLDPQDAMRRHEGQIEPLEAT